MNNNLYDDDAIEVNVLLAVAVSMSDDLYDDDAAVEAATGKKASIIVGIVCAFLVCLAFLSYTAALWMGGAFLLFAFIAMLCNPFARGVFLGLLLIGMWK